jgi:hypothetical protein
MSDDPIALLERELVRAAARRGAAAEPMSPASVMLPWPRARRRRIRVGDALSAAAAAGAVVLALAALALLGGGGGGHPASTAAATPRERLQATLAVLRRPQTAGDRAAWAHAGLQSPKGPAASDGLVATSARVATTTAWGSSVLMMLAESRGLTVPKGWTAYAPASTPARSGMAIAVDGRVMCCVTRQQIEAGRAWLMVNAKRSKAGTVPARLYVVVPDGVPQVLFAYQRPSQRASWTPSVEVHGNIAAITLGTPGRLPFAIAWLNRDGMIGRKIQFAAG